MKPIRGDTRSRRIIVLQRYFNQRRQPTRTSQLNELFGGRTWTRTRDLLHVSRVLALTQDNPRPQNPTGVRTFADRICRPMVSFFMASDTVLTQVRQPALVEAVLLSPSRRRAHSHTL